MERCVSLPELDVQNHRVSRARHIAPSIVLAVAVAIAGVLLTGEPFGVVIAVPMLVYAIREGVRRG
jgi:hypothetical protein